MHPEARKNSAKLNLGQEPCIELGLADIWDDFIEAGPFGEWRVAVNYVTEYPDVYLRDEEGESRLRIETKTLPNEADEGAARFDTLTPLIDASLDVLVVAGWRWSHRRGKTYDLLFPEIFASDGLSAAEIARERDTRFKILKGTFRSGSRPYVRAKKDGKWVTDPGNYGKLNRIIHPSRLTEGLAEDVARFAALLNTIYPKGRRSGG